MKTYLIPIFLIFAVILSCGRADKSGIAEGRTKKNDTVVDTSAVRVIKDYFSNGKVKTEVSAKGNLRQGLTKNYDRDGHILSQVNYMNNTRDGVATNFYPLSGKVNSTLVYKKGIKEGEEIWYYENGQKYRVTPYIQGKANGIQKFYYEDGKLKAELPIKDGNPGIGLKEYKQDGKLITGYPSIIIRQKDFISNANKVIVTIELSESFSKVKFYRGQLDNGKYISDKLFELATQNGLAQVDFNVPPGSSLNQKIVITANYTTPFGNPLIMSKTFTVSAVNNN